MMFTGNLFTLLNPYGLLGGLTTVAIFLLHGANFLGLKLEGELRERVNGFAKKLWIGARVLYIALGVFTYVSWLLGTWYRQPWHRPDCRSCRLARHWLLHQPQDGRLGVHHGGTEHRVDSGHLLHHDVPERDDLHHQPCLVTDHLQRILITIHADGHVHRCA